MLLLCLCSFFWACTSCCCIVLLVTYTRMHACTQTLTCSSEICGGPPGIKHSKGGLFYCSYLSLIVAHLRETTKAQTGSSRGTGSTLCPILFVLFSVWAPPPPQRLSPGTLTVVLGAKRRQKKKNKPLHHGLFCEAGWCCCTLRAKPGELQIETVWRIRDARRELICWEGATTVEAAPEMNAPVIVGGMFWEPVQSNYTLKATQEPELRCFYL